MIISIFGLLMAPDSVSFKTTDDSIMSHHCKEHVTKHTVRRVASIRKHSSILAHVINVQVRCSYSNHSSIAVINISEQKHGQDLEHHNKRYSSEVKLSLQ